MLLRLYYIYFTFQSHFLCSFKLDIILKHPLILHLQKKPKMNFNQSS